MHIWISQQLKVRLGFKKHVYRLIFTQLGCHDVSGRVRSPLYLMFENMVILAFKILFTYNVRTIESC